MDTALGNLYGNIAANLVDYVPDLKTVDIDMGQLKDEGANLPFELPAAILKIENVYYQQYDSSKRLGVVHVRLRVIYAYQNDEENYTAPHNVRTEVLSFYELIHNIKATINAITSGYHTKLYLWNESHLKSKPDEMRWTYCVDWLCNVYSDDSDISDTGDVVFDAPMVQFDNEIMRRSEISVVRIGEK